MIQLSCCGIYWIAIKRYSLALYEILNGVLLQESVNRSLLNLLTYPWIEEKVKKGVLSVHGGYYDFVDCTFEKWTLDYKEDNLKEKNGRISVKNHLLWS